MATMNACLPIAVLLSASMLLPGAGSPLPSTRSAASSQPQSSAPAPVTYAAVSRPSDLRELGFAIRGRIGEQLVQPGERVKKDQPLFRLDDAVQRRSVEIAALNAKDDSKQRLARANLEFREEDLRITEDSAQRGGAAQQDLRDARFRLETAAIELARAEHEHALDQATLLREQAQLDQMAILAPIDATVLEIKKRPGETVEETSPVLTIVNTDVLWLDVSLPTEKALQLRLGQEAQIRWDDLPGQAAMPGKIVFISPYGHGGARQITARVEMVNSANLPAGLHAKVSFEPVTLSR